MNILPEANDLPLAKAQESYYRDRLAESIPGARTEVSCSAGRIDILTPEEVIEVKPYAKWRNAVGQVVSYWTCYPDRLKRLHIILPYDMLESEAIAKISPVCDPLDIRLTFDHQRDVVVKFVEVLGGHYRSSEELLDRFREMKPRYRHKEELQGDDLALMVEVVNQCSWVPKKFQGLVDHARIEGNEGKHSHRSKCFALMSSEGTGQWMRVRIGNYVDHFFGKQPKSTKVEKIAPIDANDYHLTITVTSYMGERAGEPMYAWGYICETSEGVKEHAEVIKNRNKQREDGLILTAINSAIKDVGNQRMTYTVRTDSEVIVDYFGLEANDPAISDPRFGSIPFYLGHWEWYEVKQSIPRLKVQFDDYTETTEALQRLVSSAVDDYILEGLAKVNGATFDALDKDQLKCLNSVAVATNENPFNWKEHRRPVIRSLQDLELIMKAHKPDLKVTYKFFSPSVRIAYQEWIDSQSA